MTALPVVSAAGKGLSTIGSFLGRTALKGAKGAASLGLDAAVGTGKLLGKGVSAPFKLFSSDKDDAKKLTPEQDKEGEQKDASEESKEDQKEDREQKSKVDLDQYNKLYQVLNQHNKKNYKIKQRRIQLYYQL